MAHQYAEKVRDLIGAINRGDADRALKLFRPDSVQHDPHTAADAEGFRVHIRGLATKRPQIEVVRLLEDGPLVVAQLWSEASGQNRFAVYRFEGEQVAEQWAFSSPAAPPNQSGHTQLDGPTKPRSLDKTDANKHLVRSYYDIFHLAGDRSHHEEFFTGDIMIRHEPGVRDGLGAFLVDVEELMRHRTIDEIKLLIGQGDLVFIAASGTHESNPCVYIDLYRVEGRKLVEHWGFPQMVPPEAERLNPTVML